MSAGAGPRGLWASPNGAHCAPARPLWPAALRGGGSLPGSSGPPRTFPPGRARAAPARRGAPGLVALPGRGPLRARTPALACGPPRGWVPAGLVGPAPYRPSGPRPRCPRGSRADAVPVGRAELEPAVGSSRDRRSDGAGSGGRVEPRPAVGPRRNQLPWSRPGRRGPIPIGAVGAGRPPAGAVGAGRASASSPRHASAACLPAACPSPPPSRHGPRPCRSVSPVPWSSVLWRVGPRPLAGGGRWFPWRGR